MKKASEILKIQTKVLFRTSLQHWQEYDETVQKLYEIKKEIFRTIRKKALESESDGNFEEKASKNQRATFLLLEKQEHVPKKKGRRTKASTMRFDAKVASDSSDCKSLDDSTSSVSSTRSRRAAAQAAGQKIAQVQSLVQLKTKLRRPTNFDEKQTKAASSPSAKCRRTKIHQSAGSSSSQTDDLHNEVNENMVIVDNDDLGDNLLNIPCSVFVEKLNTPKIKSLSRPHSRLSRSLDRTNKRKSGDLFNDSIPLSELTDKHKNPAPNSDPTQRTRRKSTKRYMDSGISSNEEELRQLITGEGNLPIAHSSPLQHKISTGEFRGFDDKNTEVAIIRENTFVVVAKTEETKILLKQAQKTGSQEGSSSEKELIETNAVKSRTKVLRKKVIHTTINTEEKENVVRNNETHTIIKVDDSPNLRSRTKVLKKAPDHSEKNNHQYNGDSETTSSAENCKTIRKQNEQCQELKTDQVSEQGVRSRTKTIRNDIEKESLSDSTESESGNTRSRTRTIRKCATHQENKDVDSEYSVPISNENLQHIKTNNVRPLTPAPAKGQLVKKRIEDFEKMQSGTDEDEGEKVVGRVTRNAKKCMATASEVELPNSKQAQNIPAAKQPLTSERNRMTPLAVNNRMTPAPDSAYKQQANKWVNSANRPTPVETNTAVVHKQTVEEAERKKKEEEMLKRQAKEEAQKKKEKALKASAEETRRKRMEKQQKVTAAREAAEKEKERLAAKAEREREEKMRQIALEKEKQKEEHLKKKQIMQQKALELEERRKQEEAARLAKIKEQEKEQKRLQAMKEREQEVQKQKKADLRFAEAEKNKHQGAKLAKIAAENSAKLKMQQVATPGALPQSSDCYEVTPAREDRPLLPPKTENDYGIDDAHSDDSSDEETQPKKMIPLWAQSKNREHLLKINQYIPKKVWNVYMDCDPCPDINKMFEGNPIKRRIRTSSAVWRTPPKYNGKAS